MKKVILTLAIGLLFVPCVKAQSAASQLQYQFFKDWFAAEYYAEVTIKSGDGSYEQGTFVLKCSQHIKSARETLTKLLATGKLTHTAYTEANKTLDAIDKITDQESFSGEVGGRMKLLLYLTDLRMSRMFSSLAKP